MVDKIKTVSIENEYLKTSFRICGAELASLVSKKTGKDYIFPAIPQFWSKSSPILFPIVGCAKNNTLIHNEKPYSMHLHGFANYQDFEVVFRDDAQVEFLLSSNGRFKEVYPFEFNLFVGYTLIGKKLNVYWRVENLSKETMYFSIGGHPAFTCPIDENPRNTYYLQFDGLTKLDRSIIDMSCGLLYDEHEDIELNEVDAEGKVGVIRIDDHLFDRDALIGENNQTHKISLLRPDKSPYISVTFDAPLFGVWSPWDKKAPFICIEPWYGRCDKKQFDGELKDREWSNTLKVDDIFNANYNIEIFD
jgi:galactose mutarotase-like enzyme